MTTKAQLQFRRRLSDDSRQVEDSRAFDVWYHNEDVQRMVWALYQRMPSQHQTYLAPHVFFDGIQPEYFDALMGLCKKKLLASGKLYFPFVIKPFLGNSHYIAGIIRRKSKEDKQPTLFLFNPVGYPDQQSKERFKKQLSLSSSERVGSMPLILSPHPVQSAKKESSSLVSCGPLCTAFIEYALNHPEWVDGLDGGFELPTELSALMQATQEEYTQNITALRLKHDQLLSSVQDNDLETVDEFFLPANEYFFSNASEKNSLIDDLDVSFDEEVLERVAQEEDADDEGFVDAKEPDEHVPLISPVDVLPAREMALEPTTRKDIEAIQKEIDRLKATQGFFRHSALQKAEKIKEALDYAFITEVSDVRLEGRVKEALGEHRIFSFFGCIKARSLSHIEQSLIDCPPVKR